MMAYVQHAAGPLTVSAYRYAGTRPVAGAGLDAFERTGYGVTFDQSGRVSSENVVQTGWDSNCGTAGMIGCASSGGFTQLRYAFDRRLYALARYEGTNDPTHGFVRDGVVLLGWAPAENARMTVEDVIARTPRTTNTMNVQLTVAF